MALGEFEGLFPTTQKLYDDRGRPLLDQDGHRMQNLVVMLNPSDVFVKYSAGAVENSADTDKADTSAQPKTEVIQQQQFGNVARTMDLDEFVAMFRDLRMMPPAGHLPGNAQISFDDAVSCFREANRGNGADADITACDFEEFIVAMNVAKFKMGIPDMREDIEKSPPGMWACTFAERTLGGALEDLNKAWRLILPVDLFWAKDVAKRVQHKALQLAAFFEQHGRILTDSQKYGMAFETYERAKQLYSGNTGFDKTKFEPDEGKLDELKRAFVVNQYKRAMQILTLTAPNPSSHVGIPSHIGDPSKKDVQIDKALTIFSGMDDQTALGTTLRLGSELKLRQGNVKGALDMANQCMNAMSRFGDVQGISSAYRLLAEAQIVDGQYVQATGSIKAALQIAADTADFVNECRCYCELACVQLWLGEIGLAEEHFDKCLSLCEVSKENMVEGMALAGKGYISVLLSKFPEGVHLLRAAQDQLRMCDDRVSVSQTMFEIAWTNMVMAHKGWVKDMEEASTLLMRTVSLFKSQNDSLAQARANAQAWIWRVTSRLGSVMRTRMLQGETLIDTMQQLAWEALQEGKSVLAAIEKVGDAAMRSRVLETMASMQMLGIRAPEKVSETLEKANEVYLKNSSKVGLARIARLRAVVRVYEKDYRAASKELQASYRLLLQNQITGNVDEAETWWTWAIVKRLMGEKGEGIYERQKSLKIYKSFKGGRLCCLCKELCFGACYTCLLCYQKDYCTQCYSECAFTGRSCHPTSSMLRTNMSVGNDADSKNQVGALNGSYDIDSIPELNQGPGGSD